MKSYEIAYSVPIHIKIQLFYITMSVENLVQSLTEVWSLNAVSECNIYDAK